MTEAPITPTRVIPPGAALPARPPEPGEVPPWRATPPPAPPPPPPVEPRWYSAPAPPPPEPGPIEIRITYTPYVEPDPPYDWSWLWRWARPWASFAAAAIALAPVLPDWHGLGTVWAAALTDCRTDAGLLPAYVLASLSVAGPFALDLARPRLWTRTALAIGLIGTFGMVHPYDIVTAVTGVHP
ncbi:hypothetical protein ACFV1H_17780 [Streptomyces virginiae]|uniref:hypothetical protein n=1 Tax=Streptomyces virginiae TaxID=1961 RepID=UPI0036AB6DF9